MKIKQIGLAVSFVALCAVGIANAQTGGGVTPTLVTDFQSGNAYFECNLYGGACGDFAWKIDENPEDGVYDTSTGEFGNTPVVGGPTITISNSGGSSFDWSISAGYEVCAVIVKAGPNALVYHYGGATSDTNLYSPTNPNNGNPFDISHVTFCFSEADGGQCYQEETAWAAGARYVNRGNWATYTTYPGDGESVDIYAGRTTLVGTATFTDNGDGTVDIAINLIGGAIFYYDALNQFADENLKVQDYNSAPSGNPAPGLFDWKESFAVGSTTGTITVPLADFYGIHLDVALAVDCP